MESFPAHPSLVQYHGYFIRKRMGYIVMEWIAGETLMKAVRRRGPLDPKKAVNISLGILSGLDVLHRLGYVHGDLHSRNVIVSNFDAPAIKIIDFQHAVRKRENGKARAIRRLAKPPRELAPESRKRLIDDRYDLYSVGFMCATMLLGRAPKRRLRKARASDDALWQVIRKATHRRPEERYRSAKEMMKALNSAPRMDS